MATSPDTGVNHHMELHTPLALHIDLALPSVTSPTHGANSIISNDRNWLRGLLGDIFPIDLPITRERAALLLPTPALHCSMLMGMLSIIVPFNKALKLWNAVCKYLKRYEMRSE